MSGGDEGTLASIVSLELGKPTPRHLRMFVDRRGFLRLSGLVTIPIAVPLLSSCTRKPKTAATVATGSTSASELPRSMSAIVNANTGKLDVNDAQGETLVNSRRVAFGLVKDNAPITDAIVTVYIGRQADQPPVASARAAWVQGEMAPRALYVADLSFPQPGAWLIGVTARIKDGTVLGGGASMTVLDKSPSPNAGQPAISVATPTVATPLGADPLCSAVPPCPMHAISLDAALTSGKPTVLTIAAPAYCQSETCGPVVRLVTAALPPYTDRFNFIHVEAYDKDTVGTLQPAAAAWKLTSEPWTFFIGTDGIVKDRLPGAFGADELAARLKALEA